jgi:hypothetical protein
VLRGPNAAAANTVAINDGVDTSGGTNCSHANEVLAHRKQHGAERAEPPR